MRGGASPIGALGPSSVDDFARSVSSVQTVPVRDAHGIGQSLPSGAQTPAGSEALLAQAVAMAQTAASGGTKQKEADEIKISALPSASLFNDWLIQTSRKVATATSRSDEAYAWFLEVQKPGTTFEQFADSGTFGSLDGKLFVALEDKIKNHCCSRSV